MPFRARARFFQFQQSNGKIRRERSISFFQAYRSNFPFILIILTDERARARKIRGNTLSFSYAAATLIHISFYARPLLDRR